MTSRRIALLAAFALLLGAFALPAAAKPPTLPSSASATAVERALGTATEEGDGTDARVVIAVVDSGINPYHEFFDVGEDSSVTPDVLAELGVERTVSLTRGTSFRAAFAADRDQFDAIERAEPVWFEGTNLVGISFREQARDRHLDPSEDAEGDGTHGIGVAAAVLRANPEAIVVVVDGINADAETWAFNHPAIDAVSTSYGTPVGEPDVLGGFGNLTSSFEGVVEHGKHHFGAVANAPTPSPIDPTGGPWWSIGVAGYEEGTSEGRTNLSGSLSDFLGDFTQSLPYCRACTTGERTVGGTSFATPRSAGTFSLALLEARRAAGHTGGIVTEGVERPLMVSGNGLELTNWEFRRAMEEAAYYPGIGDYDPIEGILDLGATPIPDAAPYLAAGWGAITPEPEAEVVSQTLAHLGVAGEVTRTKDADTCDFMTLHFELRRTYWDDIEPGSDSAGTDEDPYIRC